MLVIAAGLHLRIQNSHARILHSDEAVQAYQLWELMETGNYTYDPEDKHGPLLYYFSAVLNKGLGIDGSELTRTKLRLVPIAASGLLLYFMLLGRRKVDGNALLAGSLFALSPLPVIYGSYYIQEALFTLIGFLLLYTVNEYWKSPSVFSAARCGLWAGALFATKETAIIHIAAIGFATLAIQAKPLSTADWPQRFRSIPIVAGISVFVFVWVFFYSAVFTDFSQIADSFRAFINYAERSQGAGHEKPFFYYISLFWPHTAEGIRWGEFPFLVLAAIGFVLLVLNRKEQTSPLRLVVYYGFTCFVLYSVIPYKTPWLLLTSYVSFACTAGHALYRPFTIRSYPWIKVLALGVVWYTLNGQYQSTKLANRYAADSRNPYIYQHTSPQFQKLIDRIEDLEALNPNVNLSITVIGEDNAWPLPWYLRNNDTVGYWNDPAEAPLLDVVIAPVGSLSETLSETHVVEYHGLRENVLLECWIRNGLWEAFMETR